MKTAALIASFAACASAAEWTVSAPNVASMAMGVGATDADNSLIAAGSSNSGGFVMSASDAGVTYDEVSGSGGMAFMALRTNGAGKTVATGLFSTVVGDASGFEPATIKGISQSVEALGEDGFIAAGTYSLKNGVAVSTDNGASWNVVGLPASAEPVRYVAAPSASTWYVTAGMWPADDDADTALALSEKLSVNPAGGLTMESLVLGDDADTCHALGDADSCDAESACTWCKSAAVPSSCYTVEETAALPSSIFACDKSAEAAQATNGTAGYTAQVWKTTDSGLTWELKLDDPDNGWYPNGIHCSSETSCSLVGEGDAAYIYATADGETFDRIYTDNDDAVSLMATRKISDDEFWAFGGNMVFPGMIGKAWHTTDGGKSFTNEAADVENVYLFDASFVDADHGYAVAMTAQNTGSVLTWA